MKFSFDIRTTENPLNRYIYHLLPNPSTAIINNNSKQYVRVIDDPKNKTYHEVEVQTGLQADGGLVEIISGLSDGQEIVTYVKP